MKFLWRILAGIGAVQDAEQQPLSATMGSMLKSDLGAQLNPVINGFLKIPDSLNFVQGLFGPKQREIRFQALKQGHHSVS